MTDPLVLKLRNLRRAVLASISQQRSELRAHPDTCRAVPPPAGAEKGLLGLVKEIASDRLSDLGVAHTWGELQLLFVECERAGASTLEVDTAWASLRNAISAAMLALLKRPEWGDLRPLFAREFFGELGDAVNRSRGPRMQACMETTTRLRELADDSTWQGARWLLLQVSAMEYPRFGTSGWRARMGRDFTWPRARAVASAIVRYVIDHVHGAGPIVVGYDSRINADHVAALVADVAVAHGLDVHLSARDTPSPALIHYLTDALGVSGNVGLVNCTPSHNPVRDSEGGPYLGTEYHGIRYNLPYGAVADDSVTDTIGMYAMEALLLDDDGQSVPRPRGAVTYFDPRESYLSTALRELTGTVHLVEGGDVDAAARLRSWWGDPSAMVVIDEMHSASRGYLRHACELLGIRHTVIHSERDPLLGDLDYANPEPPHTRALQEKVASLRAEFPRIIGIGTDTDSDRFGVVDEEGEYLLFNQLLPIIAAYLLRLRRPARKRLIIRNMATTRLLDRVADAHPDAIEAPDWYGKPAGYAQRATYHVVAGDRAFTGRSLAHAVPVGFKDIAFVMMRDMRTTLARGEHDPRRIETAFRGCLDRLLLAGEESNGMTSWGHAPDKDGLWGALLTLQMCAVLGSGLRALQAAVQQAYGPLVSARWDVHNVSKATKRALVNTFLDWAAQHTPPAGLLPAGLSLVYCGGERDSLVEVVLADSAGVEQYLTIRGSGTEPLNRVYSEAPTSQARDALLGAVRAVLDRLRAAESGA